MSTSPQMELVEVTPQMASRWLERVRAQRRLKVYVMRNYAADMRAGRWAEDITPIVFNDDDELVNGQHRLHAVVESGTTQSFWVRRGVPKDAIWRMDQGAPRRTGDQLTIHGITNGNTIATIAKLKIQYHLLPDVVWATSTTTEITKAMVLDEAMGDIEDYGDSYAVGRAAFNASRAHLNSYATLWLLVREMSSQGDLWDDFNEGVTVGAGLMKGDPRLAYRAYCIRSDAPKWGLGQSHLFAAIKTWNRFVDDEQVGLLKAPRKSELPLPKVK